MVVTHVQGFIATGQVRSTDQLLDLQQFRMAMIRIMLRRLAAKPRSVNPSFPDGL